MAFRWPAHSLRCTDGEVDAAETSPVLLRGNAVDVLPDAFALVPAGRSAPRAEAVGRCWSPGPLPSWLAVWRSGVTPWR